MNNHSHGHGHGLGDKIATNKLIILYFIEKASTAISNQQISQFALEFGYMEYFEMQTAITELCDAGYIDTTTQRDKNLFFISDEGTEALNYFLHLLPEDAKFNINSYLSANKRKLQVEMDVSANYFPMANGEYLVKCALLEGTGELLMEIVLVSASKEQAIQICNNWKLNTSKYYREFTAALNESDLSSNTPEQTNSN